MSNNPYLLSFKTLLDSWNDFETTIYLLGVSLGLLTFTENNDELLVIKTFLKVNDIKYEINKVLILLLEINAISHDQSYDLYRWNANYRL